MYSMISKPYVFNLNNANASNEEKDAASVISACMKGRLDRHVLHERIMNGDNEEDKIILARIEARVAESREQMRIKRQNKKQGSNIAGVKLPMLKKKKMKKKKTKKSGAKPIGASKSKGAKLAGWGE